MGKAYEHIIKHKPGITGYWQVNGRSDISFEGRLCMDMKYHIHSSLAEDTKILFKTVNAVVKKDGAA